MAEFSVFDAARFGSDLWFFFFSLGFLGPIVELFFSVFVLQRRKISFLFFFFLKAMIVALLDLLVCFGS